MDLHDVLGAELIDAPSPRLRSRVVGGPCEAGAMKRNENYVTLHMPSDSISWRID